MRGEKTQLKWRVDLEQLVNISGDRGRGLSSKHYTVQLGETVSACPFAVRSD